MCEIVLIHLAAIILAFVCILSAHEPKNVAILPRGPAHHTGCKYTTYSVFKCWCAPVLNACRSAFAYHSLPRPGPRRVFLNVFPGWRSDAATRTIR